MANRSNISLPFNTILELIFEHKHFLFIIFPLSCHKNRLSESLKIPLFKFIMTSKTIKLRGKGEFKLIPKDPCAWLPCCHVMLLEGFQYIVLFSIVCSFIGWTRDLKYTLPLCFTCIIQWLKLKMSRTSQEFSI